MSAGRSSSRLVRARAKDLEDRPRDAEARQTSVFSGGEKKRTKILANGDARAKDVHHWMNRPGLDVDAMKLVADGRDALAHRRARLPS